MQYKVFGCKVNKYYTDEWLNSEYLSDKNGLFIASCVVTDKAKKKWVKFVLQEIGKLKNNEKIYISGCGAFERGKELKSFFEIYPELSAYEKKIEILQEAPEATIKQKINNFKINKNIPKLSLTTKKFLLIQGGCNSFCTFCLTVLKRGKHFYRSKEDIVDDITEYELTGGKEIVLTGVNLGAWGVNDTNDYKNPKLSELLEYILEKTEIRRIRISSLGPEFIDDKLLKIFTNKRIYPHFHLSIQSGNSTILKAMKRHYDGEYIRKILEKIRKIKREDGVYISIGADLIVGFPGESESDFLDTYNLVKDYNITKIHTFPFSNHTYGEHVPASFFPNQISDLQKKERLNRLISLGDEIRNNFIKSQIGKTFEVLVESVKNGQFNGWTENYIEATNNNFEIISGNIKRNEIIVGKLVA
nr:MiaB/RimO family radical SAM methylthiotransferase [Candidatus Gracilibacteria bacterium]